MAALSKLGKMKAFSPKTAFFALVMAGTGLSAWGAKAPKSPKPAVVVASPDLPTVAGAWVTLRGAPLFEAPSLKLHANWGPALPLGNAFRVEKVYGRWLYGSPVARPRMPAAQVPGPGWVFSRMLLVPGDKDTLSPALAQFSRAVLFHGRAAWEKLLPGVAPSLDFYESLVLSEGTLRAFRSQDEVSTSWLPDSLPPLLPSFLFETYPEARADSQDEKEPSLGLTGTDLNFLDQEFAIKKSGLDSASAAARSKALRPPAPPALDARVKNALLGRFLLEKYFERPALTHEEVDGYIYMRATAMRALSGCGNSVKEYWKNRRWEQFRVFRLKSRPEIKHPWLEVSLPGGYFAFSARAIDGAANEAELAFLLVRPLVREMRLQRKNPQFNGKAWPGALNAVSEELWDQVLRSQSTKDSDNLDVADEIAVDMAAVECISRAGYRPAAGLSYLRRLGTKKEEPWAAWFFENAIGLDYRLERVGTLVDESLAQKKFPAGLTTNVKRFGTAARQWNLMP